MSRVMPSSVSNADTTPLPVFPDRLFDCEKVCVLGEGAWGSALAQLAKNNQVPVSTWSRSSGKSLSDCVQGADVLVSAIAMKGVRAVIAQLALLQLPEKTILITTTKGLDLQTSQTASQLFTETFPQLEIVVLSGPNLSREIEQQLPAATVLASLNAQALQTIKHLFSCPYFRIYLSDDPLGAELGGALKNILAIAVGLCDGLALGANAKAALMTRFMPELTQLGMALGARKKQTFQGLSGLGDILATCGSMLSRNYRVGFHLAKGEPLENIVATLGGIAEGVPTSRLAAKLADEKKLSLPIISCVDQIVQQQLTPQQALNILLHRKITTE